jgi:hypothetical protein
MRYHSSATGGASQLMLVRAKNAAFHRLCLADAEISKRRKRGPAPLAWLRRREQLAQEYAQARVLVVQDGQEAAC